MKPRLVNFFSLILSPVAFLAALSNAVWRLKRKESNILERFGMWGKTPTRVVWFHGASVGECLSLAPLIDLLKVKHKKKVLLTTTTVTARLVMSRLHHWVRHQVWDVWPFVALRIKRTKPSVYITVESEIWPTWLWALRLFNVSIVLLNARMSEKTMRRWSGVPRIARSVFSTIAYATTTSQARAHFLRSMGVQKVEIQPHLKYLSTPLNVDAASVAKYKNALLGRKVWMAASVHPPEIHTIVDAVLNTPGDTVSIIAPRHTHTVNDWLDALLSKGFQSIRHSQFDGSLDKDVRCIVVDTMGDLSTFYSVCPVVFVGGNLVPGIGGHNIIEPGMFGCSVVWGPYVESCQDVCDDLALQGFPLASADELVPTLMNLLNNPEKTHQKGQELKKELDQKKQKLQEWAEVWSERMASIKGSSLGGIETD